MLRKAVKNSTKDLLAIHKFYMDILCCVPNIIYWIDTHCELNGCNHAFVKWLGLKSMKNFTGTPYEQMIKFKLCSEQRIETFKLDDMEVLFSGKAKFKVEEPVVYNQKNEPFYYLANRSPILDENKHVTGLIVVLSDITDQKKNKSSLPISPQEENHKPLDSTFIPKILLVEDNDIAQKVEKALLTSLNCQVDIADSGDNALSLFSAGKYNLIFMDIGLKDTSGYLVAKKIRDMEKNTTNHVPILALTSYQADVVQYDCKKYFMDGAITKPLTNEQATQIIQHYIYHENTPVDQLKRGEL